MSIQIEDYLTDDDEGSIAEDLENELMEGYEIGPRIFLLKDPGRTQILGLSLGESDDSILVGIPAVFSMDESSKQITLGFFISAYSYIRLFKSDIGMMMYMTPEVKALYHEFLVKEALEKFPEFMKDLPSRYSFQVAAKKVLLQEPDGGLESYVEQAGTELRTPPGSETIQ